MAKAGIPTSRVATEIVPCGHVDYATGVVNLAIEANGRYFDAHFYPTNMATHPGTVTIWCKNGETIRDDGNGNLYIVKEQHD